MTWLDKIIAARDAVTEAEENSMEPEYRVRTDDHIVGTANSKLRKLYYLYRKNSEEVQAAKNASEERPLGHKVLESRIQEVNRLLPTQKALDEIFWTSCIDDFPELLGRKHYGIRHGWRIVWSDRGMHHVIDDD